MPQLDVMCYFPQVFWLGVVYMSVYVVLTKHVLPTVCKVLFVRQLKVLVSSDMSEASQVSLIDAVTSRVVLEGVDVSKTALVSHMQASDAWAKKAALILADTAFPNTTRVFDQHMSVCRRVRVHTMSTSTSLMHPAWQHVCGVCKPNNRSKALHFQTAFLLRVFKRV